MPSRTPIPHLRARRGFSFVELLTALIVASILMGFAFPKMVPMRDASNVRSAKQLIQSQLSTARQAAMRRGATATFRVNGSVIYVTTTYNGTLDTIAGPTNVYEQYGAALSVSPTLATIDYNPRGFGRVANSTEFQVTRGTKRDSLCVTTLGMIAKCGL